jgi:hypothetical protein
MVVLRHDREKGDRADIFGIRQAMYPCSLYDTFKEGTMKSDPDERDYWNAFGEEDDDSSASSISSNKKTDDSQQIGGTREGEKNHLLLIEVSEEVSLFLTRIFLSECPSISLHNRKVSLHSMSQEHLPIVPILQRKISSRGMQVNVEECCTVQEEKTSDAAVIIASEWSENEWKTYRQTYSSILRSIVPGGWLLLLLRSSETCSTSLSAAPNSITSMICKDSVWSIESCHTVFHREEESNNNLRKASFHVVVQAVRKRDGMINSDACSWGKSSTDSSSKRLLRERRLMDEVTIGRCAYERSFPPYHDQSLCKESIQKAVRALLHHGVVVLRDLFPIHDVQLWGEAVLHDLNVAISTLQERKGVDLLQPGASRNEPISYRELAMREDLRVDLRDGPSLRKLRQQEQTAPKRKSPLRQHPSVVQIVELACNPKGTHFGGNFGRWNFDGKGPDGSRLPLNYGRIGAVVSLPGCADQAIHADTPHIFEHMDLPPHYLNLFLPATDISRNGTIPEGEEFDGTTCIGGTAFLVGSHKLEVCDHLMNHIDDTSRRERFLRLLRPSLSVGDALIFDCRLLHMGLANDSHRTSTPIRRPMLYVNIMHKWFTDPKNWNDREEIFGHDSCGQIQ